MESDDKQLVRYVHTGALMYRAGDLRVEIRIDPAAALRAQLAVERLKQRFRGTAAPVAPWHRVDEANIIDQE